MDLLSTTRLAGKLGVNRDELVDALVRQDLLDVTGPKWRLTEQGEAAGGTTTQTQNGDHYIVWPEDIGGRIDLFPETASASSTSSKHADDRRLSSTRIAEQFGLSAQRINLILAEIGWIKKHIKGWSVTPLGASLGGVEHEVADNGAHYVTWPARIVENRVLIAVLESMTEEDSADDGLPKTDRGEERIASFRTNNPGTYRTKDGHWVRSRAEMIIDDALYDYGIAHAYERRLPIEEDVYCDFYLPGPGVYIEFWGLENDAAYAARKKQKLEIYRKHGFALIELSDRHIETPDDHLPRLLLQHGVRVY